MMPEVPLDILRCGSKWFSKWGKNTLKLIFHHGKRTTRNDDVNLLLVWLLSNDDVHLPYASSFMVVFFHCKILYSCPNSFCRIFSARSTSWKNMSTGVLKGMAPLVSSSMLAKGINLPCVLELCFLGSKYTSSRLVFGSLGPYRRPKKNGTNMFILHKYYINDPKFLRKQLGKKTSNIQVYNQLRCLKLHACLQKTGRVLQLSLDFPLDFFTPFTPFLRAMVRIHSGRSVNLLQQMLMRMGTWHKCQEWKNTTSINLKTRNWTFFLQVNS